MLVDLDISAFRQFQIQVFKSESVQHRTSSHTHQQFFTAYGSFRTDSLLLVPSIGLRVSQLVAGVAVVGGVIAEILLTKKFRDKPLMVELPLNSENRARMKKLDGPTAFAGTDAALPASASRAEFVEKTAAWNETVKKALDRREHPEKNEKNPE